MALQVGNWGEKPLQIVVISPLITNVGAHLVVFQIAPLRFGVLLGCEDAGNVIPLHVWCLEAMGHRTYYP